MNILFILPLGFIACADKSSETELDTELAEEVWLEMSDLQTGTASEWEGIVASNMSHGDFVQIWINTSAFEALSNGEEVPDGGIIVKESFTDAEGTQLENYTVMKKISDYNPDAADWFWANLGGDGSVNIAGAPTVCTCCHSSTEDYLQFIHL